MSDITTQIAVLETQMKNIAKQVDDGFRLNTVEHKETIKLFEEAMKLKADKEKVDSLADNQRWIVRLIIGLVATAVVGLIIKTNI